MRKESAKRTNKSRCPSGMTTKRTKAKANFGDDNQTAKAKAKCGCFVCGEFSTPDAGVEVGVFRSEFGFRNRLGGRSRLRVRRRLQERDRRESFPRLR